MFLELTEDQVFLKNNFSKLFQTESTAQRVREAQPLGFDAKLWKSLVELGVPAMRVPESLDGVGLPLLDCAAVIEEAGRSVAPVPIVDVIVSARLLAEGGAAGADLLQRVMSGDACAAFALSTLDKAQLLSQGAIADIVVGIHAGDLVAFERTPSMVAEANTGGLPVARWEPGEKGTRVVLASGDDAQRLYAAGQEEWRLLTASYLIGVQARATEMAAEYANERHAYGKPIGAYQGISHPLATSFIETEGARLLLWKAVSAIAHGQEQAPALSALVWWSIADKIVPSVGQALRTFGGYGLSLEYDIYLYHQRAIGLVLCGGTAQSALDLAGRRLFQGEAAALPDVGQCTISFELPDYAVELQNRLRAFYEAEVTPEMRKKAHHSTSAHNAEFHEKLVKGDFLFHGWPDRPSQERGPTKHYIACLEAEAHGYTSHLFGTTDIVGQIVYHFGTDEVKDEVLTRIRNGTAVCSLGFSEPGSGSDIFAASMRSTRDGDDWVLNGSKMWTTGAHYADYVILLTRSDPNSKGHKGLTFFIVPTDLPGYDFQRVDTYQDERTNITFYEDLRVPDKYRLGEPNEGAKVMTVALPLEHSASALIFVGQIAMMEAAMRWGKTIVDGHAPIERADVRAGLAKALARFNISEAFALRALYTSEKGIHSRWIGPSSKIVVSEMHKESAWELMQLGGPESILTGLHDLGVVELGHRRAYGSTIYGGTTEIHRSLTAEQALGLAKSR